MPPALATFLTFLLIYSLFSRDLREKPNVTSALWLPFLWVVIGCSREPSEWLQIWGVPVPSGTLEGGSPVDRVFYILMIVAGFRVLQKRQLSLSQLVHNNIWLSIFLLYCFFAIFWSDYPFVSLKRWIKVLANPIMALIVLTEPSPEESITRLVKRAGYILIPVSILFIKYYPHLGRAFSEWTGQAQNRGIGIDKNALGINCLILGFVYFWHFTRTLRWPQSKSRRNELILCLIMSGLNGWLISVADSKTPLISLLVGIVIVLFTGLSWVDRRKISIYLLGTITLLAAAQWMFGVYEILLRLLGRNPTLSERTIIWDKLLKVEINPIFGMGYESFWIGENLRHVWEILGAQINQAHNGYLETYLNLGLIGLLLLLGLLIATYRKSIRSLLVEFDWGRLRLGFVIPIIIYNWTEAAFKTTHPIFFILYIITLDYRQQSIMRSADATRASEV